MKRIVLIAFLALALPVAAFGDTWDITNNVGTLKGGNASLSLVGSWLTAIDDDGVLVIQIPHPGTVAFTVGTFFGGAGNPLNSLSGVGSFLNLFGSTFTINLTAAVPLLGLGPGLLFNGSFTGPAAWTPEGGDIYQLSGYVSGMLTIGKKKEKVNGFTSQLYYGTLVGGEFCGTLGSGDTILSTPEPGTLGLLGTGLVGLAGIVRKKLKA
jgi:hypothetical protein